MEEESESMTGNDIDRVSRRLIERDRKMETLKVKLMAEEMMMSIIPTWTTISTAKMGARMKSFKMKFEV